MLATRQKIDTINKAIKALLTEGKYPSLSEIMSRTAKIFTGRWGEPQAKLRPAVEWQVIGGEDGKDIERTYEEIRDDLTTYFHELIDAADATVSDYLMFQARKEILKRRILRIAQVAESTTTSFSLGGSSVLQDTFNDASLVDLSATTAELNLESGYVTLPTSLNALTPIPLSDSVVASEDYPTAKQHGSITDALTDASNTGWYASLDGDTYTCTLTMSAATAATVANGLYINPLTPMRVKVEITNDGANYYTYVDEKISQERTWVFKEIYPVGLRLSVTGTDVGIRRIKLLHTGFDERATIQSVEHQSTDLFGNIVPIDSVKLEVDEECPSGTSINYFIQPITGDIPSTEWIKISDGVAWLSTNTQKTWRIGAKGVTPEQPDSNENKFYICKISDNPVLETSKLLKGVSPETNPDSEQYNCGQWVIDYYNYNWADGDLDPSHIPTPSDWETFGVHSTGYIRPYTQDKPTQSPDILRQNPAALKGQSSCNPFIETAPFQTGSAAALDWLTIGVIGDSNVKLLNEQGNYRFTTYVYMPEDRVYANKPCALINPSDEGLGGQGSPVIAPFSIYLNEEPVIEVKTASSVVVSAIPESVLPSATFAFKRGWNKLQILVYYANPPVADGEAISTQSVGIYIGINPYAFIKTDPSVKVQASCQAERRVSEFALRHLVQPGDTGCWAWTDTAPERDILFNYSPSKAANEGGTLDGTITLEDPVLALTYNVPGDERKTAIKFKAEFSKTDDALGIPKLNSYKLIVNPTGA